MRGHNVVSVILRMLELAFFLCISSIIQCMLLGFFF